MKLFVFAAQVSQAWCRTDLNPKFPGQSEAETTVCFFQHRVKSCYFKNSYKSKFSLLVQGKLSDFGSTVLLIGSL